jgi:hypothetical protein
MKANNVLLLTAGVRRNDGPDPIHSKGIAIKSDQVGGVRHSNCYFRSRPEPTIKVRRKRREQGRKAAAERMSECKSLTFTYSPSGASEPYCFGSSGGSSQILCLPLCSSSSSSLQALRQSQAGLCASLSGPSARRLPLTFALCIRSQGHLRIKRRATL